MRGGNDLSGPLGRVIGRVGSLLVRRQVGDEDMAPARARPLGVSADFTRVCARVLVERVVGTADVAGHAFGPIDLPTPVG